MLAAWVERTPNFPNDFNARGSPEKSDTLYIIHQRQRALAFALEQIRGNRNQLYNNSFFRRI